MHRKYSNIEEKILYGKELALALQKNITKIVRDFKGKYKINPKIQQPVSKKKPAKRGRRDSTIVIVPKPVLCHKEFFLQYWNIFYAF
ncbi:unnamed protein product [Trifolium pratense]|uniref:Uncharacterized protein n=1 Tax=Trifolium pratense TaxID=57577 RepID=A0ACB0IZG1_TRIPR|nr:unnamed protein product [Trifolium pratense]